MNGFYGSDQRAFQERFETTALADTLESTIVTDRLDDGQQSFVTGRDYFFLSTVDGDGFPTVSYKGGAPGFVTVVDPSTLAFPSYDGNGMYLSMGNIAASARIGLLFIDFENPTRLRVQATATVSDDDDLLERYPGAELLVRASITQAWGNCPRYIHRHRRVEDSKYVPDEAGEAPLPPWKRIDLLHPALPAADRARAEAAGLIGIEDYARALEEDQG